MALVLQACLIKMIDPLKSDIYVHIHNIRDNRDLYGGWCARQKPWSGVSYLQIQQTLFNPQRPHIQPPPLTETSSLR